MDTLNTDIFWDIAAQLENRDLASGARVCKQWLPVTQSHLYRHITIDSASKHVHALGALLFAREDLRRLVRHLTLCRLFGMGRWLSSMYDWLLLLPEQSLVSVDVKMEDDYAFDILMDFPCVRNARQLTIRKPYLLNREKAARILASPYLESLAVCFEGLPAPEGPIHLKRLSVVAEGMPPQLPQILEANSTSTPLHRFDLRVTTQPNDREVAQLFRALAIHAQSLTRLAITSSERITRIPFMDDFILSLPSVQWLCCAYGTYTSTLLLRIPSSLHTLVLLWGLDGSVLVRDPHGIGFIAGARPENIPFPSANFAQTMRRMSPTGNASLRRLVIALPKLLRDPCQEVAAACSDAGIRFERVRMDNPVLDIMDRN
ncbi:hypothetical protein PsYK624_152470 [Phanerochaete sordida]|uniref:F-box domain-containing protein n=1 Tax=Phanerochaete sordida TaxID=48140 RepID=A0A9P3LLS6_9APHY|nr:hypothetical protein PsYK624_152470 [Phanerochaete sordida]